MLPDLQADLKAALDMGCSLFAGEAEDGRLDTVLQDAANGTLKPIYNYMDELPALEGAPTPFLPPRNIKRANHYASFDAGRGCPYQCSFCTIINVQGRKSRRRSPDDIEHLIRAHLKYGFRWFFVTDDNFARNKDWEPIFDRIIEMRERDSLDIRMIIQVDTLCHKIPNFIDKAARAGVRKVFIGLENINPANLMAAKKRQNKITEYRAMILAWKKARVITYAGYILGFPADTAKSIREDIEIIKKELPLDILEFFCLTPLPGSEDHKKLLLAGVPIVGALVLRLMGDAERMTLRRGLGLVGGLAGVALLAAFFVIETKVEAPLLPLRLFRIRTVAGSNAAGFLLGTSFLTFVFVGTLYMQQVLGFSALATGAAWMTASVTSLAFANLSQKIVTRTSPKAVMAAGMTLIGAGILWAAQAPANGNFWRDLAGPFFVAGIGTAFTFIPISIGALTGVTEQDAGVASGLLNTSQNLGSVIGVAVASSIAASHSGALLHRGYSPAAALTGGFGLAMWVCGLTGLAAIPVIFGLIRRSRLS